VTPCWSVTIRRWPLFGFHPPAAKTQPWGFAPQISRGNASPPPQRALRYPHGRGRAGPLRSGVVRRFGDGGTCCPALPIPVYPYDVTAQQIVKHFAGVDYAEGSLLAGRPPRQPGTRGDLPEFVPAVREVGDLALASTVIYVLVRPTRRRKPPLRVRKRSRANEGALSPVRSRASRRPSSERRHGSCGRRPSVRIEGHDRLYGCDSARSGPRHNWRTAGTQQNAWNLMS
jgi:hypothetical protein